MKIRRRILDRLVLRPTRDAVDYGKQHRRELASPSGTLEYFVWSRKEIEPGVARRAARDGKPIWIVLKFPGTSGRAERSSYHPLDLMRGHDGEVWTLNPPGYGRSAGRASLETHVDVAFAFIEHAIDVMDRQERPVRFLVMGNSLGCAAALGATNRLVQLWGEGASVRPMGLVFRNPPPLAEVVLGVAARYPLSSTMMRWIVGALPHEMDMVAMARNVALPAVFFRSQLDSLVTPAMQALVHEAYAGEKQIVELEGLEHDGQVTEAHRVTIKASLEWLLQRIETSATS